MNELVGFLVMYIAISVITGIAYFAIVFDQYCNPKDDDNLPIVLLPRDLYEITEMNMFGCIICCLLIYILVPVFGIVSIIYWLFHIGRKDY